MCSTSTFFIILKTFPFLFFNRSAILFHLPFCAEVSTDSNAFTCIKLHLQHLRALDGALVSNSVGKVLLGAVPPSDIGSKKFFTTLSPEPSSTVLIVTVMPTELLLGHTIGPIRGVT